MTTTVSLAIHPGEHLADELAARAMTAAELARAMGVDAARVSRLINAQVSVTGDTALRPADALGTSAELWMRLQGDYATQEWMIGDIDDRAGQDEVLLHVHVVGPWSTLRPSVECCSRHHQLSGSTEAFTWTAHLW